ncbi:hypothetical protein B0T20DRAFT_485141 [Sordaria brevicollis]|uniref:Uncharacterized protein n=1 Tax=Sordaria brevicollis TaxID=83679 RepID=A0AAE0PM73_SORBR|nr:hypothetical protein B0T20DRAFT_485141 [Sordaria brevicollis]
MHASTVIVEAMLVFLQVLPSRAVPTVPPVNGALAKRVDGEIMDYASLNCEKDWQKADASWDMLAEDIFDLRRVDGKPANGPGPNNCGRVSCRDGTAIWWCNDNPETKELDSFGTIADAAYVIYRECPLIAPRFDSMEFVVRGQVFLKDGWSVIVRGDEC